MAIAADHVIRHEVTIAAKRAVDFLKQELEFDKMMKALDGEDDVILVGRLPGVHVEGSETKMRLQAFRFGRSPSAFQHLRIDFDTLDAEILYSDLLEPLGDINFGLTITGANTQNPAGLLRRRLTNSLDVSSEQLDRIGKSKRSEHRDK